MIRIFSKAKVQTELQDDRSRCRIQEVDTRHNSTCSKPANAFKTVNEILRTRVKNLNRYTTDENKSNILKRILFKLKNIVRQNRLVIFSY